MSLVALMSLLCHCLCYRCIDLRINIEKYDENLILKVDAVTVSLERDSSLRLFTVMELVQERH